MENIKDNLKYFLAVILLAGTVLTWYVVYAEERSELVVAFLDVGQGDAIFIEAPNGNQILLDGGPNKEVLRQLSYVMPFYDRSIDVVIESHPDSDHISGLVEVLKRYDIGLVVESGVDSDSAVYKELNNLISKNGIKRVFARQGMVANLGDGIFLQVLFPDRDVSGIDTNAASIIARLVYGETEFLLTGDSPKAMENYLVSVYGKNLESDVLKVGHHGSKTSTSETFLGYVQPKYAIISAGLDNRYNHPHEEVLEILKKFGARILRTDQVGTIIFKSDGINILLE